MRIEVFAIPQFYEMDALFLGNLFNNNKTTPFTSKLM
jgi:hypothetical protein